MAAKIYMSNGTSNETKRFLKTRFINSILIEINYL